MNPYGPVAIYLCVALAAALLFTRLAGSARPRQTQPAQESKPTNAASSRPRPVAGRFPVRFYLVAMLFVIFDVEAASFYPWAVQMHALRVFGLLEMVVFIIVLAIGYAYVWKKGRLRMELGASLHDGLPGHFMLARLDDVARWAQSSSVWPLTMGLACCAIEMMTVTSAEYDIARLGSEVFRSSPRQADLMIVSGRVAQKMAPVVKRLYDQMADPKWVISMGACASSGGVFDNYAVVQGVDTIIPVDVYVPGCPPTPDGLLYAVNLIQQQIREGGRGGILARA